MPCADRPGRHGRGQDLDRFPRGRVCRRASWSRPRQLPLVDAGGELHAAGLSIGADQDPGDTAAGRTSTRSHVAGCRRASWSRPSTASPGRCRRRFSIRPVLDRPGGRPWTWTPRRRDARPGPPGHGRGDGRRQTHHGLAIDRPGVAPGRPPRRRSWNTVHRVEAVALLTTRPGCRSVRTRTRATRPRRMTAFHSPVPSVISSEMPCADRPGRHGRGQALDRFPRGRVCRRASWLRPSTRSPGRCRRGAFTRPGCRSVRTRTRATRPRAGSRQAHHAAGCRRASWSRPSTASPGRCRRGASRGRVADRCGPGPGRHGRGQDLDTLPRGRLPTCILVEALDTLPWSMPAGSFTRPGCRSVRTRTRATRPRAGPRQAPTRPVADVHPGRGPRHASPGRCRRGASRGRVADRCGPGPGRHGRGQDLDTLPRGRLPTCILVEALDSFTWSMPAGSFTRPGCRSVRTRTGATIGRGQDLNTLPRGRFPTCILVDRHAGPGQRSVRTRTRATRPRAGPRHAPTRPVADVHPGRGPRQLHLVDAGGELHAAGLPIGADQDPGDTAAGRTSTRSHAAGFADVHPGRGSRHAPPVDAGGVSPFGPFSIDQVDAPGRGPHAGETLGPGHPATAAATAS